MYIKAYQLNCHPITWMTWIGVNAVLWLKYINEMEKQVFYSAKSFDLKTAISGISENSKHSITGNG